MRNVLTNVLGAREDSEVHLQEHATQPGDTLLLCTDGVHGVLDADAIAPILARGGEAESVSNALVEAALARGSRDNLTALVVEFR